jgi:hypothetical protein
MAERIEGGGHKLEGFGRTDGGLCVLGEQIEEALFPRHQFSEPVQHLRSIEFRKTATSTPLPVKSCVPKLGQRANRSTTQLILPASSPL